MPRAMFYRASLALATLALAAPAFAHEFWIEPRDFTVEPGETLEADIKVGQMFKGNRYSFNPRNHTRFTLIGPEGEAKIASRIGDVPAVGQPVEGEGLALLVHQTTDSLLTYDDAEIFARFIEQEGLDGTLEAHAARGLPETGFREVYSRHVKALAKVGEGGGADRDLGLPIELTVEGDPYAEPMPGSVTLRATYGGEPMANALVNVFVRPIDEISDEVEQLRPRTDAEGRVTVPLKAGTRYLANVVKMREPSAEKAAETGAVWESLWASNTFATD